MRRVGYEAALAVSRALQALQHAVHGGGQPADLVVGLGLRHSPVELRGRDLVHLPADRLDGRQRTADGEPRRERDDRHQQRQPDDEELDDDGGGVKDIDQRPGHQDDSRTVRRLCALSHRDELIVVERGDDLGGLAGRQSRDGGPARHVGARRDNQPGRRHHLNQLLVRTRHLEDRRPARLELTHHVGGLSPRGLGHLVDHRATQRGDQAGRAHHQCDRDDDRRHGSGDRPDGR